MIESVPVNMVIETIVILCTIIGFFVRTQSKVSVGQEKLEKMITDLTGDVRSKIILGDSAYLVEAVPSATELTLFKPYVGADITAKTYLLFKDLYPPDDDVYEVLSMTGPVDVLEQTTIDEVFQLTAPISLSQYISYPTYFYYTNLLEDGTQEIGLYPPPDAAYHMPYAGLKRSALTQANQIITDIEPTVLHRATALAWLIVAAKAYSDSDWRKKAEAEKSANIYDGYYQHTLEEYIIVDQQRFGQSGQTDFRQIAGGRTDIDLYVHD